jgi:hypothetical protein
MFPDGGIRFSFVKQPQFAERQKTVAAAFAGFPEHNAVKPRPNRPDGCQNVLPFSQGSLWCAGKIQGCNSPLINKTKAVVPNGKRVHRAKRAVV